MFLTTFLKTEQDKYLSLPLAGRDPLGTQIVWQHRARPVVPALTAASRWPEGFQLLLTALAWWPSFARTYHRRDNEQTRFFLLFEQAAARACRVAGIPWRLPGSRRLTAGEEGVWVGLDPAKHFLLDSPLANGVWGIYRGPLANANLLSEQNLSDAALVQEIKRQTEDPALWRLFTYLNKAFDAKREDVTEIAHRSDHAVVQYLVKLVQRIPSREDIRRLFVAPSPLSAALASLAIEMQDEATPEAIVTVGQRRLCEDFCRELAQLEACERYLACIDSCFEVLCHAAGNSLALAIENLTIDMPALRTARDRFAQSRSQASPLQTRHRELCDAPLGSRAMFADWLLTHHTKISEARHTAPWVTIGEDNRLHCRLAIEAPQPEALMPATSWRNGYYLDALAALARHLPQRRQHV
jgi:hypothetical protein